MTDYKIINITQLQALLAQSKGAKIITLTTITVPDLFKAIVAKDFSKIENPYYGKIRKISVINGIVNWHYANAVNKQREREGKELDFTPSPRLWGTRLNDSPFVSHVNKQGENKLYLEVKIERVLNVEYKHEDGSIMNPNLITPFLKSKDLKKIKEHQDLEKAVILKDYDVANIITINIDGEGYIIR